MNSRDQRCDIDRRSFLGALASSAAGLGADASAPAKLADKGPVIDTHMHVWSGDMERYPFAHPWERHLKPPKIAGTVELLQKEADEFGVTHCVLVQTIYYGWDNRYLASCV